MSMQRDIEGRDGAVHIAQALHGYRNGHELLAASVSLSSDGQRALLELSDLSGSATRTQGFESYISGYPVPGERLYAFARTWLAEGATRPGSVWTHTLLLTPEQLAMHGVANLAKLFRRPTASWQASEYGRQLEISQQDLAEYSLEEVSSRLTGDRVLSAEILEAVYHHESATLPIVLSAGSSREYERHLIEVWSMQWPELRGQFAFCTGALSLRYVSGRPFDLQVVPQDRAAAIERSAPNRVLVLDMGSQVPATSATWVRALHSDQDRIQGMRAFAWRLGPELDPDRLSFGRLAQLHGIAHDFADREDWQSLLEVIGAWYPRQSSARSLKSWALDESTSRLPDPLTSLDRLLVLSQLAGASAFSEWGSSLAHAFLQTISNGESGLRSFLSEFPSSATEIAREELLGLSAEHLGDDAYVILIGSSSDAIASRALDLRPSILGEPALWGSARSRRLALSWLSTHRLDEGAIGAILHAVVVAGQPVGLGDLASRIGPRMIDVAFDLLGDGSESDTVLDHEPEWASALRTHPEQGVAWLARSESPSAAFAKLVLEQHRPGDRRLRAIGNRRWVEIAERINVRAVGATSVHAFVLAVGFHDERPSASAVVAAAFQTVHDSVSKGRLRDGDWNMLTRAFQKPRRSLRRLFGDKGVARERVLRRALVEAFGRRDWSVKDFLRAVQDPAVLSHVVKENARTKSGKALSQRLNTAIGADAVALSDRQRVALDPWIASSSS